MAAWQGLARSGSIRRRKPKAKEPVSAIVAQVNRPGPDWFAQGCKPIVIAVIDDTMQLSVILCGVCALIQILH